MDGMRFNHRDGSHDSGDDRSHTPARDRHFPRPDTNPVAQVTPEYIQRLLDRNQERLEPWELLEAEGTTNPMPEHIQRIRRNLETPEPSWEQLETEQQNQMWQRWQNLAQEFNMNPPNPTQWGNYFFHG
jgi:hypothetical protein